MSCCIAVGCGRWLVIVSPYEAGGGLRRARGRRGCAGECAINRCHHHQTWPNRERPNREALVAERGCKMEGGALALGMGVSLATRSVGSWSNRNRRTSSESPRRAAFGHRLRIWARVLQSCAKSGNVHCCAGEGLHHAVNLPSTRNRCLRRQAC